MKSVYHVHFRAPIEGEADYFFSSIAAIFDGFTPREIGCNLRALWAVNLSRGFMYYDERTGCSIRRRPVIGKKHKKHYRE